MRIADAQRLRGAITQAAQSLDDQTASTAAELFGGMAYDGKLITAGTRINWGGVVKRAAVDLWDTKENSPDAAPDLWEDLLYRDGIRIIPDTITAGTAFAKDELGWRGDQLYRSTQDANVWTPEAYPAGWEVVE